jgi:hypothetical protein
MRFDIGSKFSRSWLTLPFGKVNGSVNIASNLNQLQMVNVTDPKG